MRSPDAKPSAIKAILQAVWPNDEEFKLTFREKTLSTPSIVQYVLSKIDAKRSKDASYVPNPEAASVEHILPKRPNSEWPSGMRAEDYLRQYVNRIGNLTILTEPMNRACESKGFGEKKQIYKDSKYKITQDLCGVADWTTEAIVERQRQMAEEAAGIWVL
jgi:hypothetical protein